EREQLDRRAVAGLHARLLGVRRAARTLHHEIVRAALELADRELTVGVREHRRRAAPAAPGRVVVAAIGVLPRVMRRAPGIARGLPVGAEHDTADDAVARLDRERDAGLRRARRDVELD